MLDFDKITKIISDGNIESKQIDELLSRLVVNNDWLPIYLISESVSREVSILIDSEDNIWIDWGSIGEVTINPPGGATLPFKLWLHTHPSNYAYWSLTDRNSLAISKGILDKAIVLGLNGMLSSTLDDNHEWSEEEVKSWFEVLLNLGDELDG